MDNKYKRLLSNSLWTLIGNAGSKLMAFILLPFYTRWLNTDGYGQADLITTYSNLILGLLSFCVADGILVFIKDKSYDEKKTYFSTTINFAILSFVVWLIVFYVLSVIFISKNYSNAFVDNIWLIYAMVFSIFIQNYCQQFIIGLDKIKLYSVTGLVLCILTFILSYVLIPKYNVNGYIWSIVISHILTGLFCFIFSKSYMYYGFILDKSKIQKVLIYSIPLIPNAVMWWLVNALNRPLMEQYLGYSDIGIYAVANKFPGVISMLYGVISVSLTVSVLEEFGKPSYNAFFTKVFRLLFSLIILLSIGLMTFSETIIKVFVAPEFIDAWKYMNVLIVGSIFSCMSSYFGLTFTVIKKTKYYFYSTIWGAITSIALNFMLIPIWGLYGASIALVVSFGVTAIARYIYSKKYINPHLEIVLVSFTLLLIASCIFMIRIDSLLLRLMVLFIIIIIMLVIERNNLRNLLYVKNNRIDF